MPVVAVGQVVVAVEAGMGGGVGLGVGVVRRGRRRVPRSHGRHIESGLG